MPNTDFTTKLLELEEFYDFMKANNRQEATKRLKEFILSAQASELKEFHLA